MTTTPTSQTVPTFTVGNSYLALRSQDGEEFTCGIVLRRLAAKKDDYLVEFAGRTYHATYNPNDERFEFTF